MKIRNNKSEFIVRYDSKDYTIPEGEMEITNEGLATHILNKARAWGFSVEKIGASDESVVKPIEAIKKEEIKEAKKESKKETKKSKK